MYDMNLIKKLRKWSKKQKRRAKSAVDGNKADTFLVTGSKLDVLSKLEKYLDKLEERAKGFQEDARTGQLRIDRVAEMAEVNEDFRELTKEDLLSILTNRLKEELSLES